MDDISLIQQRLKGPSHWRYDYAATFYMLPNDQCNYTCEYCQTRKHTRQATPVPLVDLKRFWWNLAQSRGTVRIGLAGAEPSQEKDFVGMLSQLHYVNLCTNLSFEVEDAISYWDPNRMTISASYHPGMVSPVEFAEKAVELRENGFVITIVSMVDYPKYREHIEQMIAALNAMEFPTIVHELIGAPDGYEPSEYVKKTLRDEYTHKKSNKCLAGHSYFSVDCYGYIYRCEKSRKIGDIYNGFNLTPLSEPCGLDTCDCVALRNRLIVD